MLTGHWAGCDAIARGLCPTKLAKPQRSVAGPLHPSQQREWIDGIGRFPPFGIRRRLQNRKMEVGCLIAGVAAATY